jgi:hypothetical protein
LRESILPAARQDSSEAEKRLTGAAHRTPSIHRRFKVNHRNGTDCLATNRWWNRVGRAHTDCHGSIRLRNDDRRLAHGFKMSLFRTALVIVVMSAADHAFMQGQNTALALSSLRFVFMTAAGFILGR